MSRPINRLLSSIDELHVAASNAALDFRFQRSKTNPATDRNTDRLLACVAEVGDCVQAVRMYLVTHPSDRDADTFARAMRRLEGLYRMHEQTFIDPTDH
ncbi:hypothetical protein MQC88_03220 [Luteimonas sp. 50]|uniref:Uncharacterized protein n=1 Tax=Cognatiluteimonas sedimenti TaxID=2927791 RepID=A0ABT0A1X6_9GAMM|nr:hypothetical protein [Lysobacter sedimenti]MCJ0824979.1 hypothetical protein [Lysobacter sedimenti]